MILFNRKKSNTLPLGMIIGAAVGIAGVTAIAASNREIRKAACKEWDKCCRKGAALMDKGFFAMK